MKAVLIDDEIPSLNLMKRIVGQSPDFQIAGCYTDAVSALRDLPALMPDVIFTDIEMDGVSGMDLARRAGKLCPDIQIVFVTAYEQYAVDAFALDAVNYLMKPITPRALEETAARLRRSLAPRPAEDRALCFGEFEVFSRRSGEPIRWPTAKAKELFACLLCGRGRQAEKWRLCEALWPDSPPRKVENRLYSTVNRVKTALKSAEIPPSVFCDKGKYSLGAENFSCDFWEADSFFRAASGINDGNVAEYEKILALRRGALFEGEDFPWAEGMASRLERQFRAAEKSCAAYYMKNKRYEKADFHLRAVLALDPTDEESAAMLMGACFFQRKKRALQQVYAAYCGRLYEEQGEKPAPEVEKLFRSLLQYL